MSDPQNTPASGRWWWARPAFTAVLVSAAIMFLLRALAFRELPYVVVLGVCLAVTLSREYLRRVAEPNWLRARDTIAPLHVRRRNQPGGWYEGGDGMVEAVRRWDRRLDWGARDGARFAYTMGRQLGELVDERLRQRCGITRASHPEQARSIVGERVWALLGPRAHAPGPRELMAALDDLERIPDNLGQVPDATGIVTNDRRDAG